MKKSGALPVAMRRKMLQKNRKISQKPLTNKFGGGVHFYLHTSTCRVGKTSG